MTSQNKNVSTFIRLKDDFPFFPHRAAMVSSEMQWGAWIHPEDYKLVRILDKYDKMEYAEIEISFDEKMQDLLQAYYNGEVVCYDNDPSLTITPDEEGGNIELEIFWGVKYHGGLGVYKK